MVLDDLTLPDAGAAWRLVTDGVMGGVSTGTLTKETIDGRRCLAMRGRVRLENDGGFVQMARDLVDGGTPLHASRFRAIALDVHGNGEVYGVHLRTKDTARPWQSYRQTFTAMPYWQHVVLSFDGFVPHRVEAPLDLRSLRRLGLVAIGRAFDAELALARLELVPA